MEGGPLVVENGSPLGAERENWGNFTKLKLEGARETPDGRTRKVVVGHCGREAFVEVFIGDGMCSS